MSSYIEKLFVCGWFMVNYETSQSHNDEQAVTYAQFKPVSHDSWRF